MHFLRSALACILLAAGLSAATFGTAVPLVGGATDIVLDEARGRLYLVNSSQNRLEIYSLPQRRFLTPVPTNSTPISAAISRSGKVLYVTSYDASNLNVIDLDTLTVLNRVSLPARPEGVAVGGDERVLISTIGTGTANASNVLLIYDPSVKDSTLALSSVAVTPPPPTPPQLPPPSGRQFLESHSQMITSADGSLIVGVNLPNTTTRTVFVYEVSSGTVLRSRTINNVSSVLAIAPDGSKFMAGLSLFETSSLQIVAQQNLANSPYPIAPNTNFNTQTNQGGSVFSPDGSVLYSGFDIAPFQNPPARANVSQLMLSDPDNLLITLGLQLPENLAGKMVISSDGANIYALSESGFTTIPVATMRNFPIAVPETNTILLANDQCGVTAGQSSLRVNVKNMGRGQMTATAQVLQFTGATAGLGGAGGPGGGIIGGGGIILLPPVVTPGPGVIVGPVIPGGGGQTNPSILQTAPTIRTAQSPEGTALDFTFSSFAARGMGTISPSHDILVQSTQAINIPQRVRVYQNNRNAEARGDLVPIDVSITTTEGLVDLTSDSRRNRLYIANSGMNRVEVFDTRTKKLMPPIKVGQLPRSLALTPDGNTLYVVNSGGESISIVDPDTMKIVDRVRFPPIPFNTNTALVTPSIIAASQRGAIFITSAGQVWSIVGNQAVPRGPSAIVGTDAQGRLRPITAPRSLSSTPNGEFMLVAGGDGNAYLYSAASDDFIQARQIFTGNQTGYRGPIAAGPGGRYYLVNGFLMNESLTPTNAGTQTSPIAAVAQVSATTYARYTQPTRANANVVVTDPGSIELVDTNSGQVLRSAAALEGPMTQVAGAAGSNIDPRTLVVDSAGTTAYAISTTGLSVIPLDVVNAADRPVVNTRGAVNLGSYQTTVAPNALVSIFGRNLAGDAIASTAPLPSRLGGVCVTLNNQPLPLFMTSSGQINAQLPPVMAAGNYPLIVRSIDKKIAGNSQTLTVSKYAPAVLVDPSGQVAIFHRDGRAVTKDNPAKRDEPLTLYAVGLGATKGATVTAGQPSPSSPLATTDAVNLFFGDPTIKEAGIIVDWSGLTPGFIGLYQLNIRVPGDHLRGDALPVTLRIGGVDSPKTGPVLPKVAVD